MCPKQLCKRILAGDRPLVMLIGQGEQGGQKVPLYDYKQDVQIAGFNCLGL